ncbi:hypothetical protein OCS_06777 [Ophiocordyceps sinensis CO18]|uniref:Uncharacterized protein n=1 Tax=Ophiocordyceps sinensis (strain Co18 / CGMCC 3.14243) TaxID=911162 RepID=T5A530_OPHSC|nr:hypothetical protein OCS_06777 [Ophiocordyceps sinensis CO18]
MVATARLALGAASFLVSLHLWGTPCDAVPVGPGGSGFRGGLSSGVAPRPPAVPPPPRPGQPQPAPAPASGGPKPGKDKTQYKELDFSNSPRPGSKPAGPKPAGSKPAGPKPAGGDDSKTHYATIDFDKTKKLAEKKPSSSGFIGAGPRLYDDRGKALPNSKDEVDQKNPGSKWFKQDEKTKEWKVGTFEGGKEVYRKPLRGEPGAINRPQAGPQAASAGASGGATMYEKDGRLFQDGRPLPSSQNAKGTDGRWFKKHDDGNWYRYKSVNGKEQHNSKPVPVGPSPLSAGTGPVYVKDGVLMQGGSPAPSSQDTKGPDGRWFKKHGDGKWYRYKVVNGKEQYNSKPVTVGVEPA